MQSFTTVGAISNAMQSVPDDSAKRLLLALVNRDVYDHLYGASGMDDTELSEAYPEFRDNELLFQDYVGGKVILAESVEDLSALKVDGVYMLDRAAMVEGDKMISLALCTNDAGGDLYYVARDLIAGEEQLLAVIKEMQ